MASKNIHEGPYPDAELTALGFEDPEVIGMVQNNLNIADVILSESVAQYD